MRFKTITIQVGDFLMSPIYHTLYFPLEDSKQIFRNPVNDFTTKQKCKIYNGGRKSKSNRQLKNN